MDGAGFGARARQGPDVLERALLQDAERCSELSDQERIALADRLADMANRHLWRAPMKRQTSPSLPLNTNCEISSHQTLARYQLMGGVFISSSILLNVTL
jgi:hypothetical protein